MAKIGVLFLSLFLIVSLVTAEEKVTKVPLIKQKTAAEDAKSKIDTAISVMNVIKGDIDELDREGLLEEDLAEEPEKDETWGSNFRKNIDKLIKILNIVKEDVREIEKIEYPRTNYEPKRSVQK